MTILITGSTGNIGSSVATHLREAGESFVAGVRGEAGEGEVSIDFGDPGRMQEALEGVHTLFLLLPVTDDILRHAEVVLAAAKAAGVRHVVRSSAQGADAGSELPLLRVHGRIDEMLQESGLEWTLTRPSSFMQNFLTFYAYPIAQGAVYSAAGDGVAAWVDVRDIGAVNAAILRDPSRFRGQTLTVTGPEDLSKDAAVAALAAALGRSIDVVPIPDEAAAKVFVDMGMSDFMVGMLASSDQMMRAGLLQGPTTTVEDVAGRAPSRFAQFVSDHLDAWKR